MTVKILEKKDLNRFVEGLMKETNVFGVTKKKGTTRFDFAKLESPDDLCLDYDVTLVSPKKYFTPQEETLLNFTRGDKPTVASVVEAQETVIIGIHPYDLKAIGQMDKVFSDGNRDENYLKKREASILIGVDMTRASEKAFCASMDSAVVEEGFDLMLTDIGGGYTVTVGTDKGAQLLKKYAAVRDATDKEIAARDKAREKAKRLFGDRKLNMPCTDLPELLKGKERHPVWHLKAEKCLSCGSCNLVCPTCYCFDVKDETDLHLKEGRRYRVWDGCLLEDFAAVGSGENFREERAARYRHRFYRKGQYLYQKYGDIACVGCGRCAKACLPDIADPVEVYNTLKEEL
ncbi:MAG: 4Fe-4S dicluster domain-containing protein [Planctomycetota bacterium]